MPRRLTGFTPSGDLHLGNHLGAIRPIVSGQNDTDIVVFVSDLHALTVDHDPEEVRRRTLEFATVLLAAGVDPDALPVLRPVAGSRASRVALPAGVRHRVRGGATDDPVQGEVRRQQHVRMSLLTYPVLMAADILLYGTEEVPVGEDQRQHVELARDVASRFNARYGPTFTVPRAVNPRVAARIMDLAAPHTKMSKSTSSAAGALRLLDEPEVVRRKVLRAVTDAQRDVTYDPERRPGVSNLLAILAACTGGDPARLALEFDRYGQLKQAVADAVVATVTPVQQRYLELARDPGYVQSVIRSGAGRARELAREKIREAKEAIGLLAE